MKVCWTTAPPPGDIWGELADVGSTLPPLGLCYLASVSRELGWETAIVDCYAQKLSMDAAVRACRAMKPDIVGITSTTQEISNAAQLAAALKQQLADTLIILGGVHVTSSPVETLTRYPQFDLAFIGESEATLPEFLNAYKTRQPVTDIAGLALRGGHDPLHPAQASHRPDAGAKTIRLTPKRPPIQDLDALPLPAFDLLPALERHYRPAIYNYKRLPAAGLVTSRGCPGRCTFCDRSVFGNRLRMLSADRIVVLVKALKEKYGIREVSFYDDTLVAHRTRFEALCDRLATEKLDITWSCNARVDMVTPESLQMMRKAGCWSVSYGIESGEQALLDTLDKGITLDQIEKAVTWSRAAGLNVKGYYMIGLPGETRDTLKKTEDHLLRLPLNDILLEYFTPFPGTKLYEQLQAEGVVMPGWSNLNTFDLTYIPRGLDQKTLEAAYKRIVRKFYLRPRIIGDYMRRFASPVKMMQLARTFLKFIRSN